MADTADAELLAMFVDRAREVACLCGSRKRIVLLRDDRYGIAIKPAICKACGHVYASRNMVGDDLVDFYTHHYRRLYGGIDGLKSASAVDSRLRASRERILPVAEGLRGKNATCRVVELGCGGGWNLVPLRDAGFEVLGIDYDEEYVAWGRDRFGLDLLTYAERSQRKDLGTFELVILNQVLEHCEDPRSVLEDARQLLAPGGLIYVSLPFLECLRIWGWGRFFHIAHLHYFSIPWFGQYVAALGFRMELVDRQFGVVTLTVDPALGQEEAPHPRARLHAIATLGKNWLREMLWMPTKHRLSLVYRCFVPRPEASDTADKT